MSTPEILTRRDVLKISAAAAVGTAVPAAWAAGSAAPAIRTTAGPITGYWSGEGRERTAAFKGIPYGADTATTRFAPPKPPAAWTAPRACTEWAPRAPQVNGARARHGAESDAAHPIREGYHLPPDEGIESEDCLHLNVWTPALDSRKRPVMVYIHGGAYSNGTVNAALYDGTRLAAHSDVVVVTVNHRLNLFGYLYLAELLPGQGFDDSGNAGQLDLVLALEWVRDNIARFGGDPERVLIFGQSGGGAKCATLMAQPPAHGLFHRVITMSGQQVTGATPKHATERAVAVAAALKLPLDKPAEAAQTLRTLTTEQLQAVTHFGGYYGPVTDGRSLPVDPFAPTDPALSARVPMMLGNTHDETRFLIGGGQPALFALTWDTLPAALAKNAPFLHSDTVSLPVAEVIAKYREWHPEYSASDVFFAVTTDSRSWRGELIESERRAADPVAQPLTWVYQLNWRSPVEGGRFGAPHTLDIPLAFDTCGVSPGMVGTTPEELAQAQRISDIVRERFVAFAATGNPNGRPPRGARFGAANSAPPWPAFDLGQRPTMIFDLPARVEDDPRGRERRYLGQVPYTQPGT